MNSQDIKATLRWQQEMGADEALASEPQNALTAPPVAFPAPKQAAATPAVPGASPATSAQPTPSSPAAPSKPAGAIMPPAQAEAQARQQAAAADTIEALRAAVLAFDGCVLKKTATNTVFADGNPKARVMLIGEAPGAQEDIEGIPFCGQSGQLLDAMLAWVGLVRKENFYITNTLFWRPPGNRKPTPEEIAMCRPFVEKHIALINPSILVLVGGTAVTSVLNSKMGITKMRGQFMDYRNDYMQAPVPVTAIFHPSYLLRSPGQKRFMWQDLLAIAERCEAQGITLAQPPA